MQSRQRPGKGGERDGQGRQAHCGHGDVRHAAPGQLDPRIDSDHRDLQRREQQLPWHGERGVGRVDGHRVGVGIGTGVHRRARRGRSQADVEGWDVARARGERIERYAHVARRRRPHLQSGGLARGELGAQLENDGHGRCDEAALGPAVGAGREHGAVERRVLGVVFESEVHLDAFERGRARDDFYGERVRLAIDQRDGSGVDEADDARHAPIVRGDVEGVVAAAACGTAAEGTDEAGDEPRAADAFHNRKYTRSHESRKPAAVRGPRRRLLRGRKCGYARRTSREGKGSTR